MSPVFWSSLALCFVLSAALGASRPWPTTHTAPVDLGRGEQAEQWQVRGVFKRQATADLPVISCELSEAQLRLGSVRGALKGQFACTDPDGEPIFQVPITMAAFNIQRRDSTFVFDLKERQADLLDARMNGVRASTGGAAGFASFRLTIPPSEDIVLTGRWIGGRR